MTEFDAERAKVLLTAICDLMTKVSNSYHVVDVLEQTAVWDDAECDGYCLFEEAKELIGYEEILKERNK